MLKAFVPKVSRGLILQGRIMPYFVYRISEGPSETHKRLELQEAFDAYKEAKALARKLRFELQPRDSTTIKIIFAGDQSEAEERLTEVREKPILKEWEK